MSAPASRERRPETSMLMVPEIFSSLGGISRVMRLYLKAMSDEACETGGKVKLVALNDSHLDSRDQKKYSNLTLADWIVCARDKKRFINAALKRSGDCDTLICGHIAQLPVALAASLLNWRLKYYLVAHGIEVWRPYTWLERRALRGTRRLLAVSEYTRRQVLRFHPALPADRVIVVPNALDPFFSPVTEQADVAVPFAGPRILTVSRLTTADSYKGIDTLIEALPAVRRDLPFSQLRIAGHGDDVPRLTALAARLGVTAAVNFLGAVSDEALRTEYATCDLFALPSRREGFGLVYLEAMSHGKPCIAARAGGAPEVVNETVGRLVDYGDIPGLAAAVAELTRQPCESGVVRRHAGTFDFPAFLQRLAAALN